MKEKEMIAHLRDELFRVRTELHDLKADTYGLEGKQQFEEGERKQYGPVDAEGVWLAGLGHCKGPTAYSTEDLLADAKNQYERTLEKLEKCNHLLMATGEDILKVWKDG